jgi:hypothetical protein
VACSEVATWACSRGDGGALDHAVRQRRTAIYGKARRVPCAVLAARDGADGGPDSASSPRNQCWSRTRYRRRPPGTRFPHPAADRPVRGDRQLGAEPRSCFSFVKGRAWAS